MQNRRFRPWETAALLSLCLTLLWGCWANARQRSIASGLVRLHVIAASDEAEEILRRELPGIREAAAGASEGRAVTVSLGEECYPLRRYGGFALPAGRYESLRVVLGEGAGHNWWCVIFPTLCLEAAETDALQEALCEEDYALVTGEGDRELRFWLVELWGELRNALG